MGLLLFGAFAIDVGGGGEELLEFEVIEFSAEAAAATDRLFNMVSMP